MNIEQFVANYRPNVSGVVDYCDLMWFAQHGTDAEKKTVVNTRTKHLFDTCLQNKFVDFASVSVCKHMVQVLGNQLRPQIQFKMAQKEDKNLNLLLVDTLQGNLDDMAQICILFPTRRLCANDVRDALRKMTGQESTNDIDTIKRACAMAQQSVYPARQRLQELVGNKFEWLMSRAK